MVQIKVLLIGKESHKKSWTWPTIPRFPRVVVCKRKEGERERHERKLMAAIMNMSIEMTDWLMGGIFWAAATTSVSQTGERTNEGRKEERESWESGFDYTGCPQVSVSTLLADIFYIYWLYEISFHPLNLPAGGFCLTYETSWYVHYFIS